MYVVVGVCYQASIDQEALHILLMMRNTGQLLWIHVLNDTYFMKYGANFLINLKYKPNVIEITGLFHITSHKIKKLKKFLRINENFTRYVAHFAI